MNADMAMSDAPAGNDASCLQLGNTAAKTAKSTIQGTSSFLKESGTARPVLDNRPGHCAFRVGSEKTGTVATPFSNVTQQTAATLIKNGFCSVGMTIWQHQQPVRLRLPHRS